MTIKDLVDLDVLYHYNEYLRTRPDELGMKVVRACNMFADPTDKISWDNFMNFKVIVCMGKGTKE